MNNPNSKIQQTKQSNTTTIVLSIVLGIAVLLGGYFGFNNYKLSNSNEALSSEIQSFENTRAELLLEIDNLQSSYDDLLVQNSDLLENNEEIFSELEEKEKEIERIRNSPSNSLEAEVTRLYALKNEYATVLNRLWEQAVILEGAHNELMSQNADLRDQMAEMKDKNEELASKVFELRQSRETHPTAMTVSGSTQITYNSKGSGPNGEGEFQTSFINGKIGVQATNFEIIPKKKRERPTGSHKRTQKIDIYFDIKNSVETEKTNEKLFLVIKDINGISVEVENPIKTTIRSADHSKEEIIAQQSMVVNLAKDRRLKFEIIPKRKTLHEGYYRASVYSTNGLMGSKKFYLR